MRRPGLLFFALLAVLAFAPTLGPSHALADPPPYAMALDADADAPGVQSMRSVVGTDPFRVAIHVTQAATPYEGYQWEFDSSAFQLLYVSGPAENTGATGLTGCYAGGPPTYGGCGLGPPTTYTGPVTEFEFRCPADGLFTLDLVEYAPSAALATTLLTDSDVLPTAVSDMSVQCSGVGDGDDHIMSIRHSGGDPGVYGGGSVLNLVVGASFNAEVWVDKSWFYGPDPYNGFAWEIAYDPTYLVHTGANAELRQQDFGLCWSPHLWTYLSFALYSSGCWSPSPTGSYFLGHTTNIGLRCVAPTPGPTATTPILLVMWHSEDAFDDPSFGSAIAAAGELGPTSSQFKGPSPFGGMSAQITVRCLEPQLDPDNDGCSNAEETSASPSTGGKRDPFDPNDFFDVPAPALKASAPNGVRNKAVTLADVGAVLQFVGAVDEGMMNPNGYDYDTDFNGNSIDDGAEYDRTPSVIMGQPWRSGPPSGAVTLQDVGVALAQVGANCAPAP